MGEATPLLKIFVSMSGWFLLTCLCSGVDAAQVFNLAESYLGGASLTSGPEHPVASDRRLRHLFLLTGAHHRTRCQLWYAQHYDLYTETKTHLPSSGFIHGS